MAYLILLRNPLTPATKEEHILDRGETPIEWLQENHPNGFGMPIRFYINADEKPLDDLDYVPNDEDVIVIALMPGGFLAAMPLLVKVVIGLAVMAASYFAMMLFAPKEPKKPKELSDIETYDIQSEQNSAKIGDPIPVVYGDVWMTPDYASQPYTWYSWNESGWNEWFSGVQYLDILLCLGQGHVDVSNVRVGTSDAASLGAEIVHWNVFPPSVHQQRMGFISSTMGGGFYENVVTCPEVDNQEFPKPNDRSPYYTICKAGTTGRYFQFDVIFPSGLYYAGGSKGKMIGAACNWFIYWREVDQNGNLIGPEYRQNVGTRAASAALGSGEGHAEIANPYRRTFTIDTGRSARWAVMMYRTAGEFPANEGQSTYVWSGLKLIADLKPTAYGNNTILAVRVKASRGIGSNAAVRISARCKRYFNALPNGEFQHTKSPADAFYDIYTNTLYGAGRPHSELDLPVLRDLRNKWFGYEFNHVFRERTTVWEALKTSIVGMAAEPLPQGSFMSIAQDGVKPVRSMLFTDANIVEGTMKVNYIFDVEEAGDGIEVQYVDPNDWHDVYTRYPASAVTPDQVTLAGCVNSTHAAQYARLLWQRTRGQRKRITFDTELEGIILQLGDRIAVSHEMPYWGDSGQVIGVSGNTVTLDHDVDWASGAKFIMFRKTDGSPSEIFSTTQGAQPNIAVLGKALNFVPHVDSDFDYTAFTFGAATGMVRDFTVASAKHNGENTVTIEAVNYAPEIFDGAMTFLGGAP